MQAFVLSNFGLCCVWSRKKKLLPFKRPSTPPCTTLPSRGPRALAARGDGCDELAGDGRLAGSRAGPAITWPRNPDALKAEEKCPKVHPVQCLKVSQTPYLVSTSVLYALQTRSAGSPAFYPIQVAWVAGLGITGPPAITVPCTGRSREGGRSRVLSLHPIAAACEGDAQWGLRRLTVRFAAATINPHPSISLTASAA